MILAGIVLFTLLLKSLRNFVFLPYLALIEAREAATIGAEETAGNNQDQADIVLRDYRNQINEERASSMKTRAMLLSRTKADAEKIIENAEVEARQIARRVRSEIAEKTTAMRKISFQEAEKISRAMAQKSLEEAAKSPSEMVQ